MAPTFPSLNLLFNKIIYPLSKRFYFLIFREHSLCERREYNTIFTSKSSMAKVTTVSVQPLVLILNNTKLFSVCLSSSTSTTTFYYPNDIKWLLPRVRFGGSNVADLTIAIPLLVTTKTNFKQYQTITLIRSAHDLMIHLIMVHYNQKSVTINPMTNFKLYQTIILYPHKNPLEYTRFTIVLSFSNSNKFLHKNLMSLLIGRQTPASSPQKQSHWPSP